MGQSSVRGSEGTIEFAPLEYAWGQGRDRLTGQDVLAAVERRRRQFSKPSSARAPLLPRVNGSPRLVLRLFGASGIANCSYIGPRQRITGRSLRD
jgi:hypothetical protein